MSDRYLLRRFTTANFTVVLSWAWDDETNPIADMDPDDAAETLTKLESGEWGNYVFHVTVTGPEGIELARESLWGSIYADPAEFINHRTVGRAKRAGTPCGSYFSDMIGNACLEARRTVHAFRALDLRNPAAPTGHESRRPTDGASTTPA